eukprot:3551224-Rhodomonas_salina.1
MSEVGPYALPTCCPVLTEPMVVLEGLYCRSISYYQADCTAAAYYYHAESTAVAHAPAPDADACITL